MSPKNCPSVAPAPLRTHLPTAWIAGLLILAFAAQALWHARAKSVTFDESSHLAISHLMSQTGHYGFDTSHPPLMRKLFAVPFRWMDVSLPEELPMPRVAPETPMRELTTSGLFRYSALFLFRNRTPAETLVFWPRSVTVLIGCLLGAVIFRWTRQLYGDAAALLSLTLFAFCPNSIAHFSLATTDAGGTAFAVIFLYALYTLLRTNDRRGTIFCGAALGLALLAKFTNIFLPGIFLALYPALALRANQAATSVAKTILGVSVVAWFVVCAGYGFKGVFSPHTFPPSDLEDLGMGGALQAMIRWTPLPRDFIHGILHVVNHSADGHPAFLMGNYSTQGWWYYFPAALILKTPIVTLVLCALYAVALASRKLRVSVKESGIVLLAVIAIGSSISTGINIGIRHVLVVYPLIYILLGKLAKFIPQRRNLMTVIVGVLLSAEVLSGAPHYLAFFNRAVGGPGQGVRYLSDSNIDWGQDLNGLAEFLRNEGNPELVLSYFGTGIPGYYGLQYQGLPSAWTYPPSEHVNGVNPARELLAISVTNLQGTYLKPHDLFHWLMEKAPLARIGYSIYVYDITDDLASQERILEIYRSTGRTELLPRMEERIRVLRQKLGL